MNLTQTGVKYKYNKQIARILSVCTALLLWQGISAWVNYPQLIPSVGGLATTISHLFLQPDFYASVSATLLKGCCGIIAAFLLALPIGFLCGKNSFWKHYFSPLLSTLRSTPVVAFILLIILWLPSEIVAPFIALITMFPVLCENIIQGTQSIDPTYEQLAKVYKINFRIRIKHIYYPALIPFIESGTITAFGFGWKAIIMGEVLSKPIAGIGVEMKSAQSFINVPSLIAWTIVAIAVSFCLTELIRKGLQRHFLKTKIKQGLIKTSLNRAEVQDITLQAITQYFEERILFCNITERIAAGSTAIITGASGSGKSTLLNIIAGIVPPQKGDITGNHSRIGFMFQAPMLLPWLTAEENIFLTAPQSTQRKNIEGLLQKLEIKELMDRLPHQLSGGEQRRISLVRALASNPEILLIDEPFSGMDQERSAAIAETICEWSRTHGTTLIIALHEQSNLFNPNCIIQL